MSSKKANLDPAKAPPFPQAALEAGLPDSVRAERVLARRDGEVVVLATLGDGKAAVRCLARPSGAALVEWQLLRGLDAPGVARVVDWGSLDGGGLWIAREWIPGQTLLEFAREASATQLAAVTIDILRALDAIHARGVVHGDLSPNNIIVTDDGQGYLTDFGLASSIDEDVRERRAGTPIFMAPEVLIGGNASEAADLFSLAVVLALSLSRVAVDPTLFYARFPAEPFLEAAGIDLTSLPEWSRHPLTRLLSRDPETRIVGRASLADDIAARLDRRAPAAPELRIAQVAALAPRAAFVTEVDALDEGLHVAWTTDSVEAREVMDAVGIAAMKSGRPVTLVDADDLARRCRHTLDLDRHVAAAIRSPRGAGEGRRLCLVRTSAADDWVRQTIHVIGHAILLESGIAALAVLGRDRSTLLHAAESPWLRGRQIDVPNLTRSALAEHVHASVDAPTPDESTRLEEWIDRIDRLAAGSVCEANALLARAGDLGAFTPSGKESTAPLRLSASFAVDALEGRALGRVPDHFSNDARRLLAALVIVGGQARQHGLEAIVGAASAASTRELLSSGWISASSRGELRLSGGECRIADLGLDPAEVRALHTEALAWSQTRAEGVEAAGGTTLPAPESWVHCIGAAEKQDRAAIETIGAACDELQRRGLYARIARGLSTARSVLESENRPLPQSLLERLALALARCGRTQQAAEAARWSGRDAVLAEVRAIRAHVTGRSEESASEFTQAGRPLQALLELAQAAYDAGDLDALDARIDAAREFDPRAEREGEMAAVDLLGLRGLGSLHRGDAESARQSLDQALADALRLNTPLLVAAVQVNLALCARKAGDARGALRSLEAARDVYDSIGFAAGEAQVQSQLGAALRELGELVAAEEPLRTALVRRARLGLSLQASTTRGVLGLLWLERGHLRPAIDELRASSAALAAGGLHANAARLRAATDFALARCGEPPDAEAASSESVADPRIDDWTDKASRLRAKTSGAVVSTDDADYALVACRDTDPEELIARALDHAAQGRDDRSARLAIEAVYRATLHDGQAETAGRAKQLARSACEAVLAGLTDAQRSAAMTTLLGVPDPSPAALDHWNRTDDDEMDVMRILELNERLVKQEGTSTLLGAIVEAALEVTHAERGFLVLARDGVLELEAAFESSRGDIDEGEVEFSRSIVEDALEARQCLRVSDAQEHAEWSAARSVENLRLRSIMVAPFEVSERWSGVVFVDDRSRPGAFGPREERLLTLLAGQAALAIRQIQRLEENQSLASELRRRIAAQGAQLEEATRALDEVNVASPIEGLIGDSAPMQRVRDMIHRVARAEISTLISGPSGSGKEIAARAIHTLGSRSDAPFVSENCAALPPSLIESELFGAMRGSYTGASEDRAGLFERANGGTLFLDEIGELPIEVQAKLLRVLETRRIRRLGEEEEREVDFRLISATHRDLAADANEGRFRADLMYRLDGVQITMPSLAERPDDLPALVRHFLALHSEDPSSPRSMTPAVLRRLMDRAWPGNVRELSNEIRRLCVLSPGAINDPELVRDPASAGGPPAVFGAGSSQQVLTIAELERMAIQRALEVTDGDKRRAAELLGISRAKIYQRLKEWEAETS